MTTLETSHPLPGATEWRAGMTLATARMIAEHHYDVLEVGHCAPNQFAVKTRSGYAAVIGMTEKGPAILHKHDGMRTLDILSLS